MPQTQYNLTPNPAQPGQPLSNDRSAWGVRSVRAGQVIAPGTLCESYAASDGTLLARPVQDTGSTATSYAPSLVGIALLDVFAGEQTYTTYATPPSTTGSSFGGYPVGFSVPFMYRGGIWGSWDGNTGTALTKNGSINVWHSSTGANPQGVFTTKAPQTTTGAEIDLVGPYIQVFDPFGKSGSYTDSFGNTNSVVALNINLPGHI
jgi:hypothetical protein